MKLILQIVLLLIVTPKLLAQSSSLTSGGDFVSQSGSISISVGEPFCAISSPQQDLLPLFQLGVQQTRSLVVLPIEKSNLAKFEVYPNPTREQLNVSISDVHSSSEFIPYVVYSSDGKRCLFGILTNNDTNAIDVQQLASGQYILKLDTSENQQAHFIKCD
jgi:hypothetical protein